MTNSPVKPITDEQLADLEKSIVESMMYAVPIDTSLISGLISRLRLSEKDSARLDFIIADPCVMQAQCGRLSPEVFRLYWPREGENQQFWYATEREAIDAAMEAIK